METKEELEKELAAVSYRYNMVRRDKCTADFIKAFAAHDVDRAAFMYKAARAFENRAIKAIGMGPEHDSLE